ncbi:MAG TPA: alpha-L-arabinofuranosidase C-terminal domain-containing protein [Pirellulales bacterium]|jgi:alpha-L-arabinofuranosidase|nr:alpha-L-arabinofuranosidase C-terminal domain-containing protein [Pirellulales bacterium]
MATLLIFAYRDRLSRFRFICILALASVSVAAATVAAATVAAQQTTIDIRADHVLHSVSRHLTGACIEDVNHEIYGGIYSQMIFGESFQEPPPVPAAGNGPAAPIVSRMWRSFSHGAASGRFAIVRQRPFIGAQSQQMTFASGDGEVGIANEGLNHWGMNFVAGKEYEGHVWVRADKPTTLFAALESRDGTRTFAEQTLPLTGKGEWQRVELSMKPADSDISGRFSLKLKQPGSVTLGYALLQPGDWGRFKGLPVRRDVAEGLINQGITVLRYGGSMVNSPNYRWKQMIGPRDRRPPYSGTWYPYSSNGWAVPDFINFCEAAGFEYVPDFNIDESPQDMADFIEYAKAPADSPWGRKRVADGHAGPYRLPYIELGNEERVDDTYAGRFESLAAAIWAKDPQVILVVGDFAYGKPIRDPMKFGGAASRITSLAAHERILRFAKKHGCEVWFDVHVDTDHPVEFNASLGGMFSFADALDKIADGAKHKVVVFEFNSGNHAVKRALANALATLAIERDGRLPIVTTANCLQPDKQNNNGWDQGLLFLNPSQAWLQPPGYLTQILSRNFEPQVVQCDISGSEQQLHAVATRSADGRTLVLLVVNPGEKEAATEIRVAGFSAAKPTAEVTELSGPMDAVNTAEKPSAIVPRHSLWKHEANVGGASRMFPAHSISAIRFE